MKRILMTGAALAGVTAATLFLLMLMQPIEIGDADVRFFTGSQARHVLKSLGVPEGAVRITGIEVQGADGPMPETASRSFMFQGNAKTLRTFYRERCTQAAFSRPDETLLHLEPAAVCERRDASGTATVLLYPRCTDEGCEVDIEVRYLIMSSALGLSPGFRTPS